MIFIASDHAGFALKSLIMDELIGQGYSVKDIGTKNLDRVDYPVFAKKLAELVSQGRTSKGILICGTGIGMSIMANRAKKIRAALCINEYMAEMSRKHNNSNVLCIGSRVIGFDLAISIVLKFLQTKFDYGRHIRRIKMLDQ